MSEPENTPIQLGASQLTIADGVAELIHQRPESRNALSQALKDDYLEVIGRIERDTSIRALVITGEGGSFSAGGDIKWMKERLASTDPEVRSPDFMRRSMENSHRLLSRLHDLEVPVIAAVDGPAYGAGFGLALQADFVLASTRASFCLSFARIGAVPDYAVLYTLPRIVGMARAKELIMTARRVGADEAQSLGIVLSIHAPDALLVEARAFARRLADGPREALAIGKRLVNRSFETDYATMTTLESCAQAICLNTPYHQAGAARFVNGEPALYDWDRARGGK